MHSPGALLLMSCPLQGIVTLKPTVVNELEQDLCYVQELSVSIANTLRLFNFGFAE